MGFKHRDLFFIGQKLQETMGVHGFLMVFSMFYPRGFTEGTSSKMSLCNHFKDYKGKSDTAQGM